MIATRIEAIGLGAQARVGAAAGEIAVGRARVVLPERGAVAPGNRVWKVIEPESSTAMTKAGGMVTLEFNGACASVPSACRALALYSQYPAPAAASISGIAR
ncbi:hypothetical protein [Lysobacter capsici]|uniref:hypothetical protein n=1 Tax=Lysobacter capsici TaxID=435897 RepID=UPI00398CD953